MLYIEKSTALRTVYVFSCQSYLILDKCIMMHAHLVASEHFYTLGGLG